MLITITVIIIIIVVVIIIIIIIIIVGVMGSCLASSETRQDSRQPRQPLARLSPHLALA